jgi:hypothetical protein
MSIYTANTANVAPDYSSLLPHKSTSAPRFTSNVRSAAREGGEEQIGKEERGRRGMRCRVRPAALSTASMVSTGAATYDYYPGGTMSTSSPSRDRLPDARAPNRTGRRSLRIGIVPVP